MGWRLGGRVTSGVPNAREPSCAPTSWFAPETIDPRHFGEDSEGRGRLKETVASRDTSRNGSFGHTATATATATVAGGLHTRCFVGG